MALVWRGETKVEPAWQRLNLCTAHSLPEQVRLWNGLMINPQKQMWAKSTYAWAKYKHTTDYTTNANATVARTETRPHDSVCSLFCSPVWCLVLRSVTYSEQAVRQYEATCCVCTSCSGLVNWLNMQYSHSYRTRWIWNLSLVRMQGTKVFLMFTG